MAKFLARQFFPNIRLRIDRRNLTIPTSGWMVFEYETKVFAGTGNGRNKWRTRRSLTTVSAAAREMLMEGGMRLQSYWRFQYDIDIGGLTALARRLGVRTNILNTRCKGLANIIQTFDVLPARGNRRGRDYDVTFRTDRGSHRRDSLSAWNFDLNSNRTIAYSGTNASIMTTTTAVLPVNFSGSVGAEVAAQMGAEISLEPAGVGVAVSGGASQAASASYDLVFRRNLELRMLAEIIVPTRM